MVHNILIDSLKLKTLQSIIKFRNKIQSFPLFLPHKNLQEQPPQKEPPSESTALEFQHQEKNMNTIFIWKYKSTAKQNQKIIQSTQVFLISFIDVER